MLFFYPADFPHRLPESWATWPDNYAEFQKLNVEIYSVSTDTTLPTRRGMTPPGDHRQDRVPMIGDIPLAPGPAISG